MPKRFLFLVATYKVCTVEVLHVLLFLNLVLSWDKVLVFKVKAMPFQLCRVV